MFKIENTVVSQESDAYVIAEIGHNHQGKLETCKELFKAAKEAGADAVKLQKRDNKSLFTKAYYNKAYDSENAYGPTYGLHREALEFGKAEYLELQKYAQEIGVTFFSTAFDIPSANFLADLQMPAYKIASGDLKNTQLLKHVAALGKPMIISTGGATMNDIVRAYECIWPINKELSILQCTASYPADTKHLDLRFIATLKERFPGVVPGLSSHDNGIAMPVAAYVLGARVIEKHFTLNRAWKGTDHAFSLEPVGLRKMVRDLRRTREALGDGQKHLYDEEVAPLTKMGKKMVAARDLKAGQLLKESDILMKSPGDGLAAYEMDRFIGKALKVDLKEDESLKLDHI